MGTRYAGARLGAGQAWPGRPDEGICLLGGPEPFPKRQILSSGRTNSGLCSTLTKGFASWEGLGPSQESNPFVRATWPGLACRLLSVVCRLSSVCMPSVVCRQSSVVCRLSSVVYRLSFVICHLSSVVSSQGWPGQAWQLQPYEANASVGAWPRLACQSISRTCNKWGVTRYPD